MLLQKLIGAKVRDIEGLVGYAVTKVTNATNSVSVDLSGIDIRSGDLGIFIVGFHAGTTNDIGGDWTIDYNGTRFEAAHIIFSGGEADATVTGSSMSDGHAAVLVYRGYSFTSVNYQINTSGAPNPPSASVSSGDKVVISGALDDDIITMTAPSGYSLIFADNVGVSEVGSSYGYAQKDILSSGTEDPDAFGGGGNDLWVAFTYVLSPS